MEDIPITLSKIFDFLNSTFSISLTSVLISITFFPIIFDISADDPDPKSLSEVFNNIFSPTL